MSKSKKSKEVSKSDHHIWVSVLLIVVIALSAFVINRLITQISSDHGEEVISSVPMMTSSEEISHGNISKKQVIFTFDCGSGTSSAEAILAVLSKHKVKGTFFMTGKFVEQYPDLVRKIASSNNEIFNHTYNHPYLTKLSDEDIAGELNKMDMTLKSIAGVSSRPFFRPPYGDRNERVRKVAAENGYEDVYWSVDAHDWMTDATEQEVTDRILFNLSPGNIYLMHVGDAITGSILDSVFDSIESEGYKIVSLTQGL